MDAAWRRFRARKRFRASGANKGRRHRNVGARLGHWRDVRATDRPGAQDRVKQNREAFGPCVAARSLALACSVEPVLAVRTGLLARALLGVVLVACGSRSDLLGSPGGTNEAGIAADGTATAMEDGGFLSPDPAGTLDAGATCEAGSMVDEAGVTACYVAPWIIGTECDVATPPMNARAAHPSTRSPAVRATISVPRWQPDAPRCPAMAASTTAAHAWAPMPGLCARASTTRRTTDRAAATRTASCSRALNSCAPEIARAATDAAPPSMPMARRGTSRPSRRCSPTLDPHCNCGGAWAESRPVCRQGVCTLEPL